MFNMQQFAMNMIQQRLQQNPQMAQNQNMAQMINVIQSGDNAAGEQLANNILQSMGVSREQAIQQAAQFFGLK